jgi:Domain of unknown function (DUF4783)
MKKIGVLQGWILAVLLLSSFTLSSGPFDNVVKAIKNGNVNEMSRYFDNMVEITMQDQSNSYSKAQAEVILKEFFDKNPVKSFDIIHQGGNDSIFGIGNLVTSSGTFRTTFFLRQKGDNYVLQEIRFESQ